MQHHQRSFPPEFKQEAVRLLETSGTSGIQIAKDLGISDTILYRGRKGAPRLPERAIKRSWRQCAVCVAK